MLWSLAESSSDEHVAWPIIFQPRVHDPKLQHLSSITVGIEEHPQN